MRDLTLDKHPHWATILTPIPAHIDLEIATHVVALTRKTGEHPQEVLARVMDHDTYQIHRDEIIRHHTPG